MLYVFNNQCRLCLSSFITFLSNILSVFAQNTEIMNDDALQLNHAIVNNNIDIASLLIASNTSLVCDNSWPLICAAELGRVEIMSLILDAGADIDGVDDTDENQPNDNACHAAIKSFEFDALKLLVERGANVRFVQPTRSNSLLVTVLMSTNSTDERMTALLLDAGAPLDFLTDGELIDLVANTLSVRVLKSLLARNVDVSALRDSNGRSLCHVVVWNADHAGDVSAIVHAIVNVAGVDVNAADSRGATVLHYAATKRFFPMMQVVLELEPDLDRQTKDGWTALHRVCCWWRDDGRCAELLLALGASLRLVDNQGQTAFHCAAMHRNFAAFAACQAAGGDMEQQENDGYTPRTIVAHRGGLMPSDANVDASRRRIATIRFAVVRNRALEVCIGLQPLGLDALQLCEILLHSCEHACGPVAKVVSFHHWWRIATTVKHFHRRT
jgi:ankyrin repeat protein